MKNIIVVSIISLFIVSCVYNKDELPTPQGNGTSTFTGPTITYANHTKKYFDNYCIACHAVGQSVSFWPLSSFNEVSVYSNANGKIQTRVLTQGNMPPSGTGSGFLTTAEKDTLQWWLDQGAPQ